MFDILHEPLTRSQPFVFGDVHDATMDAVWSRLEAELDRLHRGPQWLADELGCSVQRVVNWRSRGVPPSAYADIARVLGWSVDRLATGERSADALSGDALALAEVFDALPDRLGIRSPRPQPKLTML